MLDFSALLPLLESHRRWLDQPVSGFSLGGQALDFNARRYLMGVINLSTDSAYRESVCATPAEAIARGRALVAQGAEFLDIGAESTLPEARRVTPEAQIEMVLPVVRGLADVPVHISVESYHPAVLEAAAGAGARVFNLTGTRDLEAVLDLARHHGAAVIHCHVQGETVRETADFQAGGDWIETLEADLAARLEKARAAGVSRNIIDPGLGFYYRNLGDGPARVAHQLGLFFQAFRLRSLGVPVMNILPHAPHIFGEANRREAEPAFALPALLGGSHLLRTHEVATVARVRELLSIMPPELDGAGRGGSTGNGRGQAG